MKRKKVGIPKQSSAHFLGFASIKSQGKEVYIEGFANKNVVDRGLDRIDPKAWSLDNFKKNPVMLLNHGMDPQLGSTPIGKVTELEPREDGLFVRGQISKLDDPHINRIRGLVEEGILRAFSVGFNPIDMQKDADGVNVIKSAELFEISLVGVPMNQDSIFSVSTKMLSLYSDDQIKSIVKAKEDLTEQEMQELADKLEMSIEDLKAELAKEEMDEKIVEALLAYEQSEPKKEEEEEGKELETTEPHSKVSVQECVAAKIPKLLEEGMEQDQAVAAAISQCQGEDGEKCEISVADYKQFFTIADNFKQADQGEDVADVTSEIPAANMPVEDEQFGSPYLETQKQTNVLLGALINEIQKMSAKLDGMVATPGAMPDNQESGKSNVDSFKKRLEDAKKKLELLEKTIGVE